MLWIDRLLVAACASLTAAALAIALATPAMAASGSNTRLVSCGAESCLLVSGRRADTASDVLINGRAVNVEGVRNWRVRVPVNTLREWSAPFARTVTVSIAGASEEARLPIGLFAHAEDLVMLTIRAE